MPKKTESQNENRGRSVMPDRGQQANREERSGNAGDFRQQKQEERADKVNDFRQQKQEERVDKVNDFRQQIREEHSGDVNNFRQQLREKKLAAGSNKNGCFPKLFMLALPLVAVGAYLLLA
jgi:hypothetical protein